MPREVREQFIAAQPGAGTGARVIASPFQFYFDGNANLRLEGWNSVTSTALQMQGQFFRSGGDVEVFSRFLTLTSDRARTRLDVPMGVGFLMNLEVRAINATPRIGQTYARVSVIRGFSGATIVLGLLIGGYVTADQGVGWPGSPIQNSIDTEAPARMIIGTDFPAGFECQEVVPTGARWYVDAISLRLTTSATAATRRPSIVYDDESLGGRRLFRSFALLNQVANQTGDHYFAVGMPIETAIFTEGQVSGLATSLPLAAAQRVRTHTEGLQGNDDYAPPLLVVRELLEAN